MSSSTLYRATPADLEIRGSDGRTVAGIAVPFGEPTDLRHDYTEVINKGAFERTIAERGTKVKFLALHDHTTRMPLGRASLLREDDTGLYGEFRVSKTREGDEALELIRDGSLDGLSIGFIPVKDKWNRARSFVERLEVKLIEVSAVPFPAYAGAQVIGVRSDGTRPALSRAQARLRILEMESS